MISDKDRETLRRLCPPREDPPGAFWDLCRILGAYFACAALLTLLWALAGLRYPV